MYFLLQRLSGFRAKASRSSLLKYLLLSSLGLSVATATVTPLPRSAGTMLVAIDHVFIPPEGNDDNDNIQLTIDGSLPNIYFQLGETAISIDRQNNTISIKQFALRRQLPGTNGHGDNWENALKNGPVSYTQDISLGQLPVGNYKITYSRGENTTADQTFHVSVAPVEQIDSALYAPITSVFIPEMIYENDQAQLVLTGAIGPNCLSLPEKNIKILRFDHLFVILPVLNILEDRACTHNPRPLQNIVSLGQLPSGRYHVMVRSMTGKSVGRTFSVLPARGDVGMGEPRHH